MHKFIGKTFLFHLKHFFKINLVTLLIKSSGLVCCQGNGSGLDRSEHISCVIMHARPNFLASRHIIIVKNVIQLEICTSDQEKLDVRGCGCFVQFSYFMYMTCYRLAIFYGLL